MKKIDKQCVLTLKITSIEYNHEKDLRVII